MDDVDDLLRGLNADVPEMSDRAFAAGRARLVAKSTVPVISAEPEHAASVTMLPSVQHRSPPRRLAPWLVAAAAVVVVGAGALVVLPGTGGPAVGSGAQSSALAPSPDPLPSGSPGTGELPPMPGLPVNQASALAEVASDLVTPGGQFRYVKLARAQAPSQSGSGGSAVDELWISADRSQTWLQRKTSTGQIQGGLENGGPEELSGPGSEVFGGSLEQLAALPTEPSGVYAAVAARVNGRPDAAQRAVEDLVGLLRLPMATAAQRSVLLRTIGYLGAAQVTPNVTTEDGRPATAISFKPDRGEYRHDLLLDPATARVIGDRNVALKPSNGVGADKAFTSSATTEALVSAIGVRP